MLLLGKIMILQGVGHPISCLGVCYANDPKKGGYMTPAPALDLTTSLRGDLAISFFETFDEDFNVPAPNVSESHLFLIALNTLPVYARAPVPPFLQRQEPPAQVPQPPGMSERPHRGVPAGALVAIKRAMQTPPLFTALQCRTIALGTPVLKGQRADRPVKVHLLPLCLAPGRPGRLAISPTPGSALVATPLHWNSALSTASLVKQQI